MSFGFSVGDFIAVGKLAMKVYRSCRDAPESFGNISIEVLSLHAVLTEVEEICSEEPLPAARQENLTGILQGCEMVLKDLQVILLKYESLGSNSKRAWDRMKWGFNDVAELRARVTSNTVLLSAFLNACQIVVQRKLCKLLKEFQAGKADGSVITAITTDSLSPDEKDKWRAIRKELADIGITIAAFDANKEFILQWFQNAVADGEFEENTAGGSSAIVEMEAFSAASHHSQDRNLPDRSQYSQETQETTATSLRSDTPLESSVDALGAALESHDFHTAQKLIKAAETKIFLPDQLQRSFSVSASHLYTILSQPQPDYKIAQFLVDCGADVNLEDRPEVLTPLLQCCLTGGHEVAQWLLRHGAKLDIERSIFSRYLKLHYGGQPRYQRAIHVAAVKNDIEMIKILLQHGENINVPDSGGQTVLHIARSEGHGDMVRVLMLELGADPKLKDKEDRPPLSIVGHYRSKSPTFGRGSRNGGTNQPSRHNLRAARSFNFATKRSQQHT